MSLLISTIHTLSTVVAALPDPEPAAPPGFGKVTDILGWAKWAGLIVAILALVGAAVALMFNARRGEGGEHLKTIVLILVGVMIIGAAASIVGFIAGA